MLKKPLTISVDAKKAGIGVETIRYYQHHHNKSLNPLDFVPWYGLYTVDISPNLQVL